MHREISNFCWTNSYVDRQRRHCLTLLHSACSLVPRFYLAPWRQKFLHGCEIKSGRKPGNEATLRARWVITVAYCSLGSGAAVYHFIIPGIETELIPVNNLLCT